MNENGADLASIIHQLGLRSKASAVCTQRRRIRYGEFLLHHALLKKHWSPEHIVENIAICRPLLENVDMMESRTLEHVEKRDLGYLDSREEFFEHVEEEEGVEIVPRTS